jgi:hypothetical protein
MGLVKARRLMAMQKQQRAKAGMKPPVKKGHWKGNGSSLIHAHLKSKMQNRWAIVIDVWDVGLVISMQLYTSRCCLA